MAFINNNTLIQINGTNPFYTLDRGLNWVSGVYPTPSDFFNSVSFSGPASGTSLPFSITGGGRSLVIDGQSKIYFGSGDVLGPAVINQVSYNQSLPMYGCYNPNDGFFYFINSSGEVIYGDALKINTTQNYGWTTQLSSVGNPGNSGVTFYYNTTLKTTNQAHSTSTGVFQKLRTTYLNLSSISYGMAMCLKTPIKVLAFQSYSYVSTNVIRLANIIAVALGQSSGGVNKQIIFSKYIINYSISSFNNLNQYVNGAVNVLSSGLVSIRKSFMRTWSFVYNSSFNIIGVKYGTNVGVKSPDGVNLTTITLPVVGNWSGLATNNSIPIMVAVSNNSNQAMSSPDGITWTARTLPNTRLWTSVTSNGSVFVAVAFNSNYCAVSSNGTTWTEHAMPVGLWNSVAAYGSIICAVSADGLSAVSTDNGVTWTRHQMPDNVNYNCIAVNNGFVAVASGPTTMAAKSTDGVNWVRIFMPYSADWTAIGSGSSLPSVI